MKREIQGILKELKSGLHKMYKDDLKHLLLYGSYARGEEETDSDIDVLMILKDYDDVSKEITRTGELVSSICLKYNVVISLIPMKENVFSTHRTPLILNVNREGIPL